MNAFLCGDLSLSFALQAWFVVAVCSMIPQVCNAICTNADVYNVYNLTLYREHILPSQGSTETVSSTS